MADQPFRPTDRVTDQAFNKRLGDLDRRIAATEKTKESVDEAVSDLLKIGLDRINSILVPAIEKINAVADLGFLQAASTTEHTLNLGDFLTFTVLESPQRDLFTPTKFVALTRLATYDDYAIARVVSYDREHGDLYVEVLAIHGNPGPHDDWEITAATGALLAQIQILDDVLATRSGLEAAVSQVAQDRSSIHTDMEAVKSDRLAIAGNNAAAVAAITADNTATKTATASDRVATLADKNAAAASALAAAAYRADTLDASPIPATLDLVFNTPDAINPAWFTRAGVAYAMGPKGVYLPAAANEMRIEHDLLGDPLGYLGEEQRINQIRNAQGAGAIPGNPGTMPTNWGTSNGGLTRTFVGSGTEKGLPYIDLRFSGISTGSQIQTSFEISGAVAASNGQTWAVSSGFEIVGGSAANITAFHMFCNAFDGSNAYLTTMGYAVKAPSAERQSNVITIASAAAASIVPYLDFSCAIGAAIDVTVRIYAPQLELGAFASSPIITTGAAATRAVDNLVIGGTDFAELWNPLEGTIYVEGIAPPNGTTFAGQFYARSADDTQRVGLFLVGSSRVFTGYGKLNNVNQPLGNEGIAVPAGQAFRLAMGLKSGSAAMSLNGRAVIAATGAWQMPPNLDRLIVGRYDSAASAPIKRISYIPKRLTDAQLRALSA